MALSTENLLVAEIRKLFGNGCFDAMSIKLMARDSPELLNAFVTAVPHCLDRRSGRRLRISVLRKILADLADEYFVTDQYGWMYLKEGPINAEPPHDPRL
jgi:hypothetical protein